MVALGPFITVVSGLPRSGTSLMMQMLVAGGMPVLSDHIRTADADNPEGYFEFEAVKDLPKGDFEWLDDAQGKAVKIISALLEHLPDSRQYRVVFMRRRMGEILASQRKMLERRGEPADTLPDDKMASLYARHVTQVEAMLAKRPYMAVLNVDYNALVLDPLPAARNVNDFLGGGLDVSAMANAVNQGLYRNREAHHPDSAL
jgi:hypothetical protein